jgi:hypothetical protein
MPPKKPQLSLPQQQVVDWFTTMHGKSVSVELRNIPRSFGAHTLKSLMNKGILRREQPTNDTIYYTLIDQT